MIIKYIKDFFYTDPEIKLDRVLKLRKSAIRWKNYSDIAPREVLFEEVANKVFQKICSNQTSIFQLDVKLMKQQGSFNIVVLKFNNIVVKNNHLINKAIHLRPKQETEQFKSLSIEHNLKLEEFEVLSKELIKFTEKMNNCTWKHSLAFKYLAKTID